MADFNFEPQYRDYALSLRFGEKYVKQMNRDELLALIGFLYYTPPSVKMPEMPEVEEIEPEEPEEPGEEKPRRRRR